jgi:hypothetical protein
MKSRNTNSHNETALLIASCCGTEWPPQRTRDRASVCYATRNKSWGDGPYIRPIAPDDPVDPMYILYVFRENSRYNRRYEQRRRMKELLGRRHRSLVEKAKYKRHTKKMFLESLTAAQADAIRRIFNVEPGIFWRAARGRYTLDLPPRLVQLGFDFMED